MLLNHLLVKLVEKLIVIRLLADWLDLEAAHLHARVAAKAEAEDDLKHEHNSDGDGIVVHLNLSVDVSVFVKLDWAFVGVCQSGGSKGRLLLFAALSQLKHVLAEPRRHVSKTSLINIELLHHLSFYIYIIKAILAIVDFDADLESFIRMVASDDAVGQQIVIASVFVGPSIARV